MNKITEILLDYALKLKDYSQSNMSEPKPMPLIDEAEQAISDLINEAINEAESLWHYEDGIEVAESMARDIRTKLGLTTKENK